MPRIFCPSFSVKVNRVSAVCPLPLFLVRCHRKVGIQRQENNQLIYWIYAKRKRCCYCGSLERVIAATICMQCVFVCVCVFVYVHMAVKQLQVVAACLE